MESSNIPDLDRLLENELQRQVSTHPGHAADPGMARYHAAFLRGGMHMPFGPGFVAGISAKAAIGLAVATLAVGGGAVAAAATTHSINPVVWGETVVGAVKTCKAEYGPSATTTGSTTAKENVGQCVSAVAKTHGQGQTECALHAHGTQGGSHNGLSSSHPTGRPANLPAAAGSGKPNGLPTSKGKGRPNSNPSGH